MDEEEGNAEAQRAYMAAMAAVMAKLERLTDWAGAMGDVTPAEVNWANVGDAAYIADVLDAVVVFVDDKG